jgi:adenine-specific DNA-methyltransferase
MDEVFGEDNFVSEIIYKRGGFQTGAVIANTFDLILWYAKNKSIIKSRTTLISLDQNEWYGNGDKYFIKDDGTRRKAIGKPAHNERLHSDRSCFSATGGESSGFLLNLSGFMFGPPSGRGWSTNQSGVSRLFKSNRLFIKGKRIRFTPFYDDYPFGSLTNIWTDTIRGGFSTDSSDDKIYVVQTQTKIIQRCILMTTDPGDLVLDPTCGSGTTAYVAEQWGRRWITIDTSRVALALARSRVMGARYPYYLLADSEDGHRKELELGGSPANTNDKKFYNRLCHGFVYERVPHITLKSIANNAEIDVIWDQYTGAVDAAREQLKELYRNNMTVWSCYFLVA